jgi:hypothetical protein
MPGTMLGRHSELSVFWIEGNRKYALALDGRLRPEAFRTIEEVVQQVPRMIIRPARLTVHGAEGAAEGVAMIRPAGWRSRRVVGRATFVTKL